MFLGNDRYLKKGVFITVEVYKRGDPAAGVMVRAIYIIIWKIEGSSEF